MGNENKPMLYTQGATEIPFNINDTDGLLYMLDRDFGGCTFLPFSKPMNPDIPGKALLDGEETGLCAQTDGFGRGHVDAGREDFWKTDGVRGEENPADRGLYRHRGQCDGSGGDDGGGKRPAGAPGEVCRPRAGRSAGGGGRHRASEKRGEHPSAFGGYLERIRQRTA